MLHRRLKSLKIKKTVVDNISDNVSYLCGINNSCPDLEVRFLLLFICTY